MTVKEAKTYLLSVRRAKQEAARYDALKRQARDLACAVTASPEPGSLGGDLFARYAQYSAMLDERVSELYDRQTEVASLIARVQDSRYRELLLGYYVQGLTWERVADDMGYSLRHVLEMHGDALLTVARML